MPTGVHIFGCFHRFAPPPGAVKVGPFSHLNNIGAFLKVALSSESRVTKKYLR